MQLFVLFEHASGYALFRTMEFEEIALFLPQVQKSILDTSKFRSTVNLASYQPFKTASDALRNMKDIAKGCLPKELKLFLENNVPKSQRSMQAVILGVQDSDLADMITKSVDIKCTTTRIVSEITRGIRTHFCKLVRGFKSLDSMIGSQRALGHHYSRAQVNFDKARMDNMVIGTLKLMDQLEQDIRKHSARLRQLYSIHFPELSKIVPDCVQYVKCVEAIGNHIDKAGNISTELENILGDSSVAQDVIKAYENSMGMNISDVDLENIKLVSNYVVSLTKRHEYAKHYLEFKMHQVAPNLSKIIGEKVGAQLISRAGGLMNLAKLPASTVQVLGAGKSLFRLNLSNESSNFGLISESAIFKATKRKTKKFSIVRLLANKCSLACRTDCFIRTPTDIFCDIWQQQIESRLKFFEERGKKDVLKMPDLSFVNVKTSGLETKSKVSSSDKFDSKVTKKLSEVNQVETETNEMETEACEFDLEMNDYDSETNEIVSETNEDNLMEKHKGKTITDMSIQELIELESENLDLSEKKEKISPKTTILARRRSLQNRHSVEAKGIENKKNDFSTSVYDSEMADKGRLHANDVTQSDKSNTKRRQMKWKSSANLSLLEDSLIENEENEAMPKKKKQKIVSKTKSMKSVC